MSLKIEKVKICDIKPYAKNSKEHTDKQISQIRDSIIEFGYNDLIAIDENNEILEGHGRFEALKQIYTDPSTEIEVVRLSHMSEKEKKKYRIIHNKLNTNTGFNFEALKQEFDSIGEPDFFKEIGFDKKELDLINPVNFEEDLIEVNSYERAKNKTKVQIGDLFQLGDHRLMCGDSTNEQHVKKLQNEEKNIVLMVTDPPYGVNYDPKWRDEADKKGILGNKYPTRSMGEVANDDQVDWAEAYKLFPGDVAYVWHAGVHTSEVQLSLERCGYEIKSQIIWAKPHFALSRGDYHWKHEPCWYAVKHGKNHNWQGSRSENTVWEIAGMNAMGGTHDESDERTGHGTQKPIQCMLRPILNNSKEGDGVYDPFGGSGSTLIACERAKRKCYMMELDPAYIQMIIDRFEKITGKKAVKLE